MSAPATPTVEDFARQAVEYVRRAVGLVLEYDSDTLPVLDHYLRTVRTADPSTIELVVVTAGAYFGETIRRVLGGRWDATAEDAGDWRMVLATGLSFSPVGFAAAAIAQADVDDFDTTIDAPPRMRPYVQDALSRMGEVTEEEYYSLCGRLDTLEHLHEVLVAVAAKMMGDAAAEADDGEGAGEPDDDGGSSAVN
jgi:hypothetical protein